MKFKNGDTWSNMIPEVYVMKGVCSYLVRDVDGSFQETIPFMEQSSDTADAIHDSVRRCVKHNEGM